MGSDTLNNKRIAFIHSSAGPNDTHKKYALSIGADLIPEDGVFNLYQQPISKLRLITGWTINALSFYKLRKYDIIITDSFRISVTIAKILKVLKPDQKIILFFGSEQLIKLKHGDYSGALSYLYDLSLKKANGFINLGIVNQHLTTEFYKNTPSIMTFNGIEREKMNTLLNVQPALEKNVFFVMANLLSVERAKTKGVDIALSAYNLFKEKYTNIESELIIAGEIAKEVKLYFTEILNIEFINSVNFVGKVVDLPNFYQQCSFGLNLSRYDAWSLVVNESLLAGVPCLVSLNTGSKVIIENIERNLIVSEDINEIAKRMKWLCDINEKKRKMISEKGRKISKEYTEERAINIFRQTFNEIRN